MASIAMEPANDCLKLSSVTGKIQSFFAHLADAHRLWRKYQRQLSELRQFSDGELAELGIRASDISHIFDDEASSS